MNLLYLLESIRMPGLNEFMLAVTYFGDELAFLVAALILFWCVDKRQGYYVLSVGFFGTLANQFLKITCRIPRPWVQDPNFTILEQAREAATGYSFPSGHSSNAVGTFGGIAYTTKNKIVKWLCIAVCVLVPLSRMYVGVHTPADVLVGSGMALAFIFIMKPVVYGNDGKNIPKMLAAGVVLSMVYLAYVEFFPFPADTDEANLASAQSNAYTLIGALAGMLVVYFVDENKLHFPVKAVWWAQILKVVIGLVLALAVKEGLKTPLNLIFGGHMIARAVRYFLLVLVAGILWPLSFRWFAGLGRKEETP